MEPAQRLARAAQLRDLVEDERDGLLHAPVWILLVAITCLDEADGGRHHQFAATCLLVPGRERALTQQIELVLVKAALKAEQ